MTCRRKPLAIQTNPADRGSARTPNDHICSAILKTAIEANFQLRGNISEPGYMDADQRRAHKMKCTDGFLGGCFDIATEVTRTVDPPDENAARAADVNRNEYLSATAIDPSVGSSTRNERSVRDVDRLVQQSGGRGERWGAHAKQDRSVGRHTMKLHFNSKLMRGTTMKCFQQRRAKCNTAFGLTDFGEQIPLG